MLRRLTSTVAVMTSILVAKGSLAAELDVPMDRGLITVRVLMGVKDKEQTRWSGTYSLSGGRIIATQGWKFLGDDYATTEKFSFLTRKLYPRFYKLRGRSPKSFPVRPNGVLLTIADRRRDSVLRVGTNHGDFEIPVGGLGYGNPLPRLDGQVNYQRVPTSRQIVKSPTEDSYPDAVRTAGGGVLVAYLQFTHGKGFERRPPVTEAPADFSMWAEPTGGDRVMFTELKDGVWSEPRPLSEPGGDLYRVRAAVDGQQRVWVVWSANIAENWDLYARVREGGKWSDRKRITSTRGSDFNHDLATDSQGSVWLVWQSFGSNNSDIYAARAEGAAFGRTQRLSSGPRNDWSPAVAASDDGQVAVAWDSYGQGDYDVLVRTWRNGEWGPVRTVAGSIRNECRPDCAYDRENRLWVVYEDSPQGWGKDYGPYDRNASRVALYQKRRLGLRVLTPSGGAVTTVNTDVNLATPMPNGNPRYLKSPAIFRSAGPKVMVDERDRVWVASRQRLQEFDSVVGGTWMTFLTSLDGNRWRPAVMVPETDGWLHDEPALLPAPGGGLYVVSATDGRWRTAASFGLNPAKARKRSAGAPPASTRKYGRYADWQFNKEIAIADTASLIAPSAAPQFADISTDVAIARDAERAEAQQVSAIRGYRADVSGKALRIVRGEFHRHTEFSSDGAGDGSIFDMWRYGIDMASLDWIGCGDHDNGSGREYSWWLTQKTTSLLTVPGAFTPMYTYERSMTYPDGHRNAMFSRRGVRALPRLRNGTGKAMDNLPPEAPRPHTPDVQMFYRYLKQFDGICASHTSGTDMGTDWRDSDPQAEPIVEIYQGDRQNYERPGAPRSNSKDYSLGGWRPYGFVSYALMRGIRLGFQSSSDHISTHMSYCNVWVEKPTRENIIAALKRRHVYASTDNIIADVRCAGHFMGDEFTLNRRPTLEVKLQGTAPFAEVVVIKDNEYVYSIAPHKQEVSFQWTDQKATPGKTSYYYVRGLQEGKSVKRTVRSPDGRRTEMDLNNGEVVWVSPMWIRYEP